MSKDKPLISFLIVIKEDIWSFGINSAHGNIITVIKRKE